MASRAYIVVVVDAEFAQFLVQLLVYLVEEVVEAAVDNKGQFVVLQGLDLVDDRVKEPLDEDERGE